jgi:uncharacterized protein Usg
MSKGAAMTQSSLLQITEVEDFRFTTAEILYSVPAYPDLSQSFLWRSLDRVPDFPKLNCFLDSWEAGLNGKFHLVRITYVKAIDSNDWEDVGIVSMQ